MAERVHPELETQLSEAGSTPVQAVLQLRASGEPERVPSPEESSALAETVLHRVQDKLGRPAIRSNLLRNLATLVVEADAPFLRTLIKQPEILSALPNKTSQSPVIPPRGVRPV